MRKPAFFAFLTSASLLGCASTPDAPVEYDAMQSARVRAYIDAKTTLYPGRNCYPWLPSKNDGGIYANNHYSWMEGFATYWGLSSRYGHSIGMPFPDDRRKLFYDESIVMPNKPLTVTFSIYSEDVQSLHNMTYYNGIPPAGIPRGTTTYCPIKSMTFTPLPGHDYEVSLDTQSCSPQLRELITQANGTLDIVNQTYDLSFPCNF